MEVELTFRYNDDERFDKEAHLRIIKSMDLALAVSDIQEKCRETIKYSEKEEPQWEEISTFIHETLEARGIYLDDMLS